MVLIANMPNRKRNSRNFPFGNTLNVKLLHQIEPTVKFCQWLIFIMLPTIDLIDSWVEIEISIVAHNLPKEKYNFEQNRCQIGNFTNVPATGWYETENKCDICAFYQ